MTDQLTFDFQQAPPPASAELLLFPPHAMRKRLRDTAAFILSRPEGKKRRWHFKHQVNLIWHEGKTARLPDHIAGAQMRAFSIALENEMRKQLVMSILIGHGAA